MIKLDTVKIRSKFRNLLGLTVEGRAIVGALNLMASAVMPLGTLLYQSKLPASESTVLSPNNVCLADFLCLTIIFTTNESLLGPGKKVF